MSIVLGSSSVRCSGGRAVPARRPQARRLPLLAACVLLVTTSVAAQSSQYTAPGGGVAAGTPTADEIEAQMEAARWRLGPVRLAPWLAITGLTWNQNVFVEDGGETDDVTGAVGAGLTAYLPTGPKVFWIAQAMPEYLWWLDLDERNEVIGRYGGGVVADLNRLRLAANVHQSEQQSVVTVESPQQVVAESRGVTASGVLALTSTLQLVAGVSDEELDSRLPGDAVGPVDFSLIDRHEQVLRGELRYEPGDLLFVGIGIERTETEFDDGARDLSNRGTSPFVTLGLDGNSVSLTARFVRRELEPDPGSDLVPLRQTQGSFRLGFTPGWRFTIGLYGSRAILYALDGDYSHLTDERFGMDVGAPFGDRLTVRAFVEGGGAEFEPLGASVPRTDDLMAYGADLTYEVGEWLAYRAGFQQVEFDSDLPGLDRDYARITSTLVLSTGDWVWR